MIYLLGVYDYTVILTEFSLLCAVFGISQAIRENFILAILCLACCGICDAFDGRIARTKKNRTNEEKAFGIQLDSLCDQVCFGVLPGIIGYQLGVHWLISGFFCLAAVIRLSWFNVLEWNRQKIESGCMKTYHGLPVTSVSGLLPLIYAASRILVPQWITAVFSCSLVLIGILFIVDFKLKKPGLKEILLLIAGVGIILGVLLLIAMSKGGIIS